MFYKTPRNVGDDRVAGEGADELHSQKARVASFKSKGDEVYRAWCELNRRRGGSLDSRLPRQQTSMQQRQEFNSAV